MPTHALRLAVGALMLAAHAAAAQDMPLFTIIKDGEGWVKGEGKKPKPAPETKIAGKHPACKVLSPGGDTLHVGWDSSTHIWAYQTHKDGSLGDGAPYAPLRIRKGYDNSREARDKLKADPPTLAVTALAVDADGRIYAATPLDLQIFDPTGRLCGVVALPADGKPDYLGWEGEKKDTLVLWIGDQKWTRKLQATGK
jgi:enterochelin esterase family protein